MNSASEYLDQSFDDRLSAISGMKWLPWVGKGYSTSERKVLVLGESIYNLRKGCAEMHERMSRVEHLRHIHLNHALNFGKKSKFVRNIERAIFNKRRPSVDEKEMLWSSVLYHNLVLRILKTSKHRPSYEDYYSGWAVVDALIEQLEVENVLVYGLESSKLAALKDYATSKGIWEGKTKGREKIGRSFPQVVTLKKNDRTLKLVFIRHPSSYFSWQKWSPVINEHFGGLWASARQ